MEVLEQMDMVNKKFHKLLLMYMSEDQACNAMNKLKAVKHDPDAFSWELSVIMSEYNISPYVLKNFMEGSVLN